MTLTEGIHNAINASSWQELGNLVPENKQINVNDHPAMFVIDYIATVARTILVAEQQGRFDTMWSLINRIREKLKELYLIESVEHWRAGLVSRWSWGWEYIEKA